MAINGGLVLQLLQNLQNKTTSAVQIDNEFSILFFQFIAYDTLRKKTHRSVDGLAKNIFLQTIIFDVD